MPETYGEKTLEPTPYRRERAREEGHVAQSHDLSSALVLLAGVLALWIGETWLVEGLGRLMVAIWESPWQDTSRDTAVALGRELLAHLASLLLPLLLLLASTAALSHLVQTGLLIVPKRLVPDPARIDPLRGWQRLFSLNNAVRILLGLLKMVAVAGVAGLSVWWRRQELLNLTALATPEMAAGLSHHILLTLFHVSLALLVLALLDYGFQRWKYEQDLRMTPQEMREELRTLQGDPQILARRRQIQRQLAMSRLQAAVPRADVVITNPTELAVALRYDPHTMAAPVVTAKGAGRLAQRIRQLAIQHGVPVVERKPLAQFLYRHVEINQPIPPEQYAAVAEILRYVYQLKNRPIPGMPP